MSDELKSPQPPRESYPRVAGANDAEHGNATAHQSDEALAAALPPDPAIADDTGEFDEPAAAPDHAEEA
ncbi:MAG TPA: hypothetical protein VHB25_08570 [Gemmatimonadaceae bacterium]|nr:hypothetical protein [Gemmatimonadaceae bacterium]